MGASQILLLQTEIKSSGPGRLSRLQDKTNPLPGTWGMRRKLHSHSISVKTLSFACHPGWSKTPFWSPCPESTPTDQNGPCEWPQMLIQGLGSPLDLFDNKIGQE